MLGAFAHQPELLIRAPQSRIRASPCKLKYGRMLIRGSKIRGGIAQARQGTACHTDPAFRPRRSTTRHATSNKCVFVSERRRTKRPHSQHLPGARAVAANDTLCVCKSFAGNAARRSRADGSIRFVSGVVRIPRRGAALLCQKRLRPTVSSRLCMDRCILPSASQLNDVNPFWG